MGTYTQYLIKREAAERRYARLQAARELGRHTDAEWLAILIRYDFRCTRCGYGEQFTGWRPCKDHIVSLLAGGSDSADNLQPLCRSCNTAKHKHDDTNWGHYRDRFGWSDVDYEVVR